MLLVWSLVGLASTLRVATACSCLRPSLEGSMSDSAVAISGEVVGTIDPASGGDRHGWYIMYNVSLLAIYKEDNCELGDNDDDDDRPSFVVVKTRESSAACGTRLQPNQVYLLFGDPVVMPDDDDPYPSSFVMSTYMCLYNRIFDELSEEDLAELEKARQRRSCPTSGVDDGMMIVASCVESDCGTKPLPAMGDPCPEASYLTVCEYNNKTEQCQWNFPASAEACPVCESDDDCVLPDRQQYCSGGRCRDIGSCRSVGDCLNPFNKLSRPERCPTNYHWICLLPEYAGGVCYGACGSICPSAFPVVNCLVRPCETATCDEDFVSCVDNYCGGCNALFFNGTGDLVCEK